MEKIEDDMEGLVTSRDPALLEEMIHRQAENYKQTGLLFTWSPLLSSFMKPHLRYWEHPVLHPNHYLVVELCHSLVFAYAALRLVDSTLSLYLPI